MRVVCKYTEKGDGIENEDAVGFADNAFWVIDGATDLFKKKIFGTVDDVAFYVRMLVY